MLSAEKEELNKAQAAYDALLNRTYLLMVEFAAYFGVPAIVGVFLGDWLDVYLGNGTHVGTVAVLLGSFVVSWLLVIVRYRQVTGQLREAEEHLKKVKQQIRERSTQP